MAKTLGDEAFMCLCGDVVGLAWDALGLLLGIIVLEVLVRLIAFFLPRYVRGSWRV
jgi:hypothetical protein